MNNSIKILPCVGNDIRLGYVLGHIYYMHNFLNQNFLGLMKASKPNEYDDNEYDEAIKEIRDDILEEMKQDYSNFYKVVLSKDVESISKDIFWRNNMFLGFEGDFVSTGFKPYKEETPVSMEAFSYFYTNTWKTIVKQFVCSLENEEPFAISIITKKERYLGLYPELEEESAFEAFKKEMYILLNYNGFNPVSIIKKENCAHVKISYILKMENQED